jgi:hypothetical protein
MLTSDVGRSLRVLHRPYLDVIQVQRILELRSLMPEIGYEVGS